MFSFLKKIIYKPANLTVEQKEFIVNKYLYDKDRVVQNSYFVQEGIKILYQSFVFSLFMLSICLINMLSNSTVFYGNFPIFFACLIFIPIWYKLYKEFSSPLIFELNNIVIDKKDYDTIPKELITYKKSNQSLLEKDRMISSDILFSNIKEKDKV